MHVHAIFISTSYVSVTFIYSSPFAVLCKNKDIHVDHNLDNLIVIYMCIIM